jgi:PAS domain S-box-containing protein
MMLEDTKSEAIGCNVSPSRQGHWWRSLFDQSDHARVVCRADGTLFAVNRKAAQLLALPETAAECGRSNILTRLTAGSGNKVMEMLRRAPCDRESLLSVSLLVEGKICLLADLEVAALDEVFSLITLKDANCRWRMEAHAQRVMSAVNATPEVIYLTGPAFKIEFINRAFTAATGYAAEDVLGKTADILRSPAGVVQMQSYLASVKEGVSWTGELENVRADGVRYTVDARISPLFDAEGMLIGYAAFERDAARSPRGREEAGDRSKSGPDRNRIQDLEQQLYQTQKMALVGSLTAGAVHDFNNLLQVISGNASLISMDPALPDSMRRKVQVIEQASARASTITQELLSFSRVSDEQIAVVDFNQIIQEAGQLFHFVPGGDVELKLAPASRPALVSMDSTRARQIVLNLCANAVDAMPHGGRLVLGISLLKLAPGQAGRTQYPPGSNFVCCSVTNTGACIPQEQLHRIFDPLYTTQVNGKGTGLGLSIVRGIVNQANGFIEVESEQGQGTVIKLYIPCAQAELGSVAVPARPTTETGLGRILVVDDLDLMLELTVSCLRTAGYEVLPAASAEAALEILETEKAPIDLLLTDYKMNGMNGGQLIETVAARNPDMKFIMASGFLSEDERKHLKGIANVRILDKPYKMHDASAMIAETLASKRQKASMGA